MTRDRADIPEDALKGWQLTALVGVVGALGVAGCSSSSSSSQRYRAGASSAPRSRPAGSATSGTIVWSASPIADQRARRHPDGADQRLREAVPEHPRHPGVRADEHRHQPGHAGHGDLGRLGHPGRLHGRRDLARPVRRAPARRAAVGLPAGELLRAVRARAWSRAPATRARSTAHRCSRTRASCTTARTCWPRRACRRRRPGSSWKARPRPAAEGGLVKYGFVWQGASYEGLTCNFMEYLASAGGTATNSDYTTATLDSPAAIKAVTFMRSLVTSGVTPAAITTFQEPQAMNTFAAGNAAFLRNWDYAYSDATTSGHSASSRPARSAWSRCRRSPASRPPGTPTSAAGTCTSTRTARTSTADLTFIKFLASPHGADHPGDQVLRDPHHHRGAGLRHGQPR